METDGSALGKRRIKRRRRKGGGEKGTATIIKQRASPAENGHPWSIQPGPFPEARAMLPFVPMSHVRPLVGAFRVALFAPSAPGPGAGRPASPSFGAYAGDSKRPSGEDSPTVLDRKHAGCGCSVDLCMLCGRRVGLGVAWVGRSTGLAAWLTGSGRPHTPGTCPIGPCNPPKGLVPPSRQPIISSGLGCHRACAGMADRCLVVHGNCTLDSICNLRKLPCYHVSANEKRKR